MIDFSLQPEYPLSIGAGIFADRQRGDAVQSDSVHPLLWREPAGGSDGDHVDLWERICT